MSFLEWMNARALLYEQRFGTEFRARLRNEIHQADALSERGRKTAALLRAKQPPPME